MINEERYTITLSRLEVCDLMLACTHVVFAARDEMKNDPECPEYRRDVVLPGTIEKWQNLHDKIHEQFTELDAALMFSQILKERKSGEYLTREAFEREAGRRLGFLLPVD